jgi:16S rRNA (guanine527-N7)-methyltransferase
VPAPALLTNARAASTVGAVSTSVPEPVIEAARAYGAALDGPLGELLAGYLARLLETNRAFNLTTVTDPDEAWTRHVLDSLTLLPALSAVPAGSALIDVGSGGGLPGIPVAAARPDLTVTLLEATAKKARFLDETARALGLANVRVVNDRAETFGQGAGRGRYAVVTSRALSALPVLLELTIPLLEVGGLALAIKGARAEAEIAEAARALSLLHAEVAGLTPTATGVVVRVRKLAATPARFPRRPGEPKRSPL